MTTALRLIGTILALSLATAGEAAVKTVQQPARSLAGQKTEKSSQERIAILSIIPSQGEPGMTVTLSGTGFSEKAMVFLGSAELPARLIAPKQLSFEIPRLATGLYALFVKNDDGSTSRTLEFSILPVKPVAVSLSPDVVPVCSMVGSRDVTVNGRNFQEGAQVLFDGGAIRSRYLSAEAITFSVPAVKGGMHQVQVRNPEDTHSTPLALLVDNRPEIVAITPGADFVNYYELVIDGRNFLQGSTVVVDGRRISQGAPPSGERDRVRYLDCTRLIYERFPADPTSRPLHIQVINPGSEESPVVTVNTP
jgi:hypothetical protein